ncbi:hypothetical protein D3C73_1215070 [compost metagenome]
MINTGLERFIIGIVKGIPFENDLDELPAETPDLPDLLVRRSAWHIHFSFNAQRFAGISYALRMVAGAGADDAFGPVLSRQAANHIVCAANFERTDNLQIFTLQIYITAIFG